MAYNNRGLAYSAKGRYDEAVADFTKAVEIDPRSGLGYAGRAIAYYSLRDYGKAWGDVYKAQGLGFQIRPEFLKALRKASGREIEEG